jgi:hypothetical protein
MTQLNKKANVQDVDLGFKKMGNYIMKGNKKVQSPKIEEVSSQKMTLLSEEGFGSTEALTNMGKYEIIKTLQKEIKERFRGMESKLEGFLGKVEFYSFCDKFADFTNSYDKMKTEIKHQMEELYERISSEVSGRLGLLIN